MYLRNLKRASARILFPLLSHSRSDCLTKPFYSGLGSILMFHRVCSESSRPRIRGNAGLEVTPEYLENTVKFLRKNNYEIVSLSRMTKILNDNYKNKKFAVLTFDDGYIDNYMHAYPLLKKHKVPFTIYVTTNFPDGNAVLWWYILEDLILKEARIEFQLNGLEYQYSCASLLQKERAYKQIHGLIFNGPSNDLRQQFLQVFKNYDINFLKKTSELALTWEQIREMSRDPLVEIGAHTINHHVLSKLPDSAVQKEIEGSRDKIESEINQKVEHFSYPFGTRNEVGQREFGITKKCGFKTSTTTCVGNIFKEHKDLLAQLPRIPVNQKRDNGKINYLNLWLNGTLPCIINKFKKIL